MGLIYSKTIHANTKLLLWKREEDLNFYFKELNIPLKDLDRITNMTFRRMREWVISRYLLKLLCPDNQKIIKDKFGKPHLDNSNKFISLSHSQDYFAAIISDIRVGIDIQKRHKKIHKIEHKFISEKEALRLDQNSIEDSHHIFWGAKEAMYKAYGRKSIRFKENMYLYPFKVFDKNLSIKGWLRKDQENQEYDIFVKIIDDYFLVYSILNHA